MAIDLNTAPYYDDFSPTNNFYRILFKPGRAVQARELTQLQSILHNQIEQFGRNIFKEGSIVIGGRTFINEGLFLKIISLDTDKEFYDNKNIIGSTSGAVGIVKVIQDQTVINGTTYQAIFHVVSIRGVFRSGESFVVENTGTGGIIDSSTTFQGPSTLFSVDESVFFTKGNFVYCEPQTIVVSTSLTAQPSARLGLTVTEEIITSDDDSSLLDPAVGSSNYFAPGADRLAVELTLTSFEYDPTVEGSDTVPISNFIEIANLRSGIITSQNKYPDYAYLEDTLARRTFDESGDYTVRPFTVKVRDHIYGDNTKLSLEISPGKAYVKGYEFETTSPTFITIDRAQDYVFENAYPVAIDYGRYVSVSNVIGYFNHFSGNVVTIHSNTVGNVNVTSNVNFWNSVIGTARTRYLDWVSGNVFNLYLYDISLNSANVFSQARSFISIGGPTVISSSNVIASANTSGNVSLTYSTDDSLLFRLPYPAIRSLSDQTYTSQLGFTGVNFTSTGGYSNATITLSGSGESFIGSGILSSDARQERFFITVTSGTGEFTAKRVLDLTTSNCKITIISPTSAQISFTSANNFTGTVTATVQTSPTASQSKIKTLTTANVTVQHTSNVFNIDLGYPDVYNVVSITDYLGNSYLGSYTLDNGQRDDYYDFGRVYLNSSSNAPNLIPNVNGNVTVSFKYFSHSGSGSYFGVNSYTNSGITYGEIPQYTTSKGVSVSLADVIDFRPVRSTSANTQIVSSKLVTPGSTFTTDYDYYLSRKDNLVLTKERRFTVDRGISELISNPPTDNPDGMKLYTINLPAYTGKISDVSTTFFDHRRYTMRDIGKIDKRVGRIEYYSALSFLEKIATDERVSSIIPGIDRFKNGILVDPFAGHSIGDVNNVDYKCSVDPISNTLRPPIVYRSIPYEINSATSTNYIKYGDVLTPTFTINPYITQLQATKAVNLTPFEVFNWTGRMTLDPATDIWADTINNGTVNVNLNGENDAFTVLTPQKQGISAWSTTTGYKTIFSGVTDISSPTVTTATSQARVNLNFSASRQTITTNLGTKVVDTSISPFMRSKVVKFYAKGLKPNTTMYASFDDVDVSRYVNPALEIIFTSNNVPTAEFTTVTHSATGWSGEVIGKKNDRVYVVPDTTKKPVEAGNVIAFVGTAVTATVSSTSFPSNLVTDQSGDVAGSFTIPNDQELKFNIGERTFRLADSFNKAFISTAAETKYLAFGISNTKQDTVLSTRYNLINITPSLDVSTTGSPNSRTSAYDAVSSIIGTATTTVSSVNLAAAVNYGASIVVCGQNPRSSGKTGQHLFIVNLGTSSGLGNIICSSGVVPNMFNLNYSGKETSTGFISSGALAQAGGFNDQLLNQGYTGIAQYSTPTASLPFYKQINGFEEYALLTVTAPLAGTAWSFTVSCPTAASATAPATALIVRKNTSPTPYSFITNFNAVWGPGESSRTTSKNSVNYFFEITNTAANPVWHMGGSDKNITVNSISATLTGTVSAGIAPVVRYVGSYQIIEGVGDAWEFVTTNSPASPTFPGQRINQVVTADIGPLPVTILPGESRTFVVNVSKPFEGEINGALKVSASITGAGGLPVAVNTVTTPLLTTVIPRVVQASDPIAQTFFVDSIGSTATGVFISSIDIWFYEKDNNIPTTVEIRPTVNGYPSSTEIVPFALASLTSDEIIASTTFNVDQYSRFTFQAPVYLPPGEYALVVRGDSTKYKIYSAVLGGTDLSTGKLVSAQPYIGSMFKSQNASTWSPEQTEDITFRINQCVFSEGQEAIIELNARALSSNIPYDVLYPSGDIVKFDNSNINFFYKTTSNTTLTLSAFTQAKLDTELFQNERKVLLANNGTSLPVKVTLKTFDSTTTPIFDLNRFQMVAITNIVNNDATGEDSYLGGNALAKYITRKVTLSAGFESTDIKVYLNAYCPKNSSIKVYYKVNNPGSIDFDRDNKYVEFNSTTIVGDHRAGFGEYTIGNTSNKCIADGSQFNTFIIKIVMLSDDPVYVPIIRDLRVIAVDD